mgnify:CR=1 FL=1
MLFVKKFKEIVAVCPAPNLRIEWFGAVLFKVKKCSETDRSQVR